MALYLPQFHPTPENDAWWNPGFTEWTNAARARPRYRGHYQPRIPADLGFYDLRLPESRTAQARLASTYGVEAFCYYHYWFAGRRLLNRPFDEVVASGEPDFPFCLCWANQTWTGIWHGAPNRVLMEQTYPGESDYRAHFEALLPAFRDRRYVKVDGKLLFLVYAPDDLPDARHFIDLWRTWGETEGLPGFHFCGTADDLSWVPAAHGFDSRVLQSLPRVKNWFPWSKPVRKIKVVARRRLGRPSVYSYREVVRGLLPPELMSVPSFPCVVPDWDNTARSGALGRVLHGSTPQLFADHLREAVRLVADLPRDRRVIFVKSWNEWAEGNYLEPDLRFGHGYLEAVREVMRSPESAIPQPSPAGSTREDSRS